MDRPWFRYLSTSLIVGLLLSALVLGRGVTPPVEALDTNLLVNGNFDELDFHWHYPNHFVAEGWYRWWIEGTWIPEYDDVAKPGGGRTEIYIDGGHAQVYFAFGRRYTAGIYQPVEGVTPCRPYEFSMWARTHSHYNQANPQSRIGLDPRATPFNTAPNTQGIYNLPSGIVWSEMQTTSGVWEKLSVTTEPLGTGMTAILYASPVEPDGTLTYGDTFWDAGELVPMTYADGRLPDAVPSDSGFIHNIAFLPGADNLTVTWDTQEGSLSQVWYNVSDPATPVTPTTSYSHTVYFPLISYERAGYDHATPIDYAGATSHQAVIDGLTSGQTVKLIILARHLENDACLTEYWGPWEVELSAAGATDGRRPSGR